MLSSQEVTKYRYARNLLLIAMSGLLIFPCSPLPTDANARPSENYSYFHSIKPDPQSAATIKSLLTAETDEKNIQIYDAPIDLEAAKALYETNQYEPLWVKRNVISPQGVALLTAMADAGQQGLNTSEYSLAAIHKAGKDSSDESAAKLDILISNSVRRFLSDMLFGVSTDDLLQTNYLERTLPEIAQSGDIHHFIASLNPTMPEYSALLNALDRYRSISEHWPEFTVGKKIDAGESDGRITVVRKMLAMTGDLTTDDGSLPWDGETTSSKTENKNEPEAKTNSTALDEPLQEAVKRFQSRHGLEADGTLGKDTQTTLAAPLSSRIEQMEASLERIRRMPRDLGERHVLVNIPGFYLKAVDNGEVKLESKVIVGRPSRRTPLMDNVINQISFNPSWGVPERIARHDLLPKIQNDPEYLSRGGFTLYDTEGGDSVAVDPNTIDWESVDQENFTFRLRQHPGRGNALGKIKFNIPDSDGIYLHSTSEPKLFSKAKRALSSGCVRVEKTRELAQFILGAEENWDEEKINATYDSSASRIIKVEPVKLHIIYLTSWIDSEGAIHFSQDVYGKDAPLIAALKRTRSASGSDFASR